VTERFFILNYEPGPDVGPPYLSGSLNFPEFEWDVFCQNPRGVSINREYVFTVTDKDVRGIDFDFYGEQSYLVSDRFLALSEDLQVDFRSVPVKIVMPDGKSSKNKYSYFLPATYISLLDQEKSSYAVDVNVETGELLADKLFPGQPVYEKIDRFFAKNISTPNLFVCTEILQLVCTNRFRKEVEEQGLKGIRFTTLDETYVYDPWADW
jgi:hypothetical protein